jgi:cobalt-zinc-cadmium efflux system outer membrane protein
MRIPVIFAPLRLRAAFFCFSLFSFSVSGFAANLSDVIAGLETTSPSLAEMRMQIAEAKSRYQTGRAWPNPQLQGGQEYIGADKAPVETSIGIGQDLGFLWSQTARVNASRAEYEASLSQFKESRQRLVSDIIVAANIYTGNRILQTAMDSLIADALKLEKTLSARREAGDISHYDEARLQIELRRFRQQKYDLAISNQETLQELSAMIGISGSELEDLVMDLQVVVPEEMLDVDRALEYGLQHRGIILAAELRRESARNESKAAKASQIPGFNIAAGKLSIDGNDAGLFWEAGLEIPLFAQRRAEVQRTQTKLRTSEIMGESVKRKVEQEIRGAILKKIQLADLTEVPTEDLLSNAAANIKRGTLLYLEGELSIFELVDVLRSGYEAQVSAVALKNAAIAANVELLRSTGAEIMETTND